MKGMVDFSGTSIARNTILSICGQIIPLLAGIITIPFILKGLGPDRFGILVLAWTVVGYYSLFDLGLGSALTKLVSENIAAERKDAVPELFWGGTCVLVALGFVGMAFVLVLARIVVNGLLIIPASLRIEAIMSFRILGFSLPIVLLTAGLLGYLAANGRFDLINYARIPLGVSNFISPIIVIQFTKSVPQILLVLVFIRVILLIIAAALCFSITPNLAQKLVFKLKTVRELFGFGLWVTVSNIISPLMLAADRFLIGSIVSIRAVAFYATPYDLLSKILTIPGSISYVLFPTFSAADAFDKKKNADLFARGLKYTYLVLFPVIFVIIIFSHEFFKVWIGRDFADKSYLVLQILSIGVLINGLSLIPYVFIQGVGRPDITGRLHIFELIVYAGILAVLVFRYGIIGAAISFVLRVLLDGLLLVYYARKYYPEVRMNPREGILIMVVSIVILISSMAITSLGLRVAYFTFFMAIFLFVAWKRYLETGVKQRLLGSLRALVS